MKNSELLDCPVIVLLGPTGAGKSPLGDRLERDGIAGRPCRHFDFGRELRRADADVKFAERRGLTEIERAVIAQVLRSGALLEGDSFGIARKLLDGFIAERCASRSALLVLNGFPRHVDQAEWLDSRLRVLAVVELVCDAATVLERIRRNTGGDRADRTDDDREAVRRRLDLYCKRTAPLTARYDQRGVPRITLRVGPTTTAAEMAGQASARLLSIIKTASEKPETPLPQSAAQ